MKKNFIFCLCVAVIALFTSCEKKEGVYNPSKQIQKIYTIDDGEKELEEVWHWDGKVLTSIDYVDGMNSTTATFSYDKQKRMVAMDAGGAHTEFIYDGKYIKKIEITYEGVVVSTTEIEHKNGKISEMRLTDVFMDDDVWDKMLIVNPMRFVIPEAFPVVEKTMKKCAKAKGNDQIIVKLNWKGDNANSMEITSTLWGQTMTELVELTFDNMNNPMYGLFSSMNSDVVTNLFVNKNNALTMNYNLMGEEVAKVNYTYEYEDNYPTKITMTTIDGDEVDTETYIYEY
jgi:hypothetical protein